jgi:hypothetical protein
MVFRNTEFLMGWIISREKNIKQTMETASANETDIAYCYGMIRAPCQWTGLPESVPIIWILGCKHFTESIIG